MLSHQQTWCGFHIQTYILLFKITIPLCILWTGWWHLKWRRRSCNMHQHHEVWCTCIENQIGPMADDDLEATLVRWRHQMETFFALLAICAGNSPVPGEFPAQRPVTRSFIIYFDLNKRLSKQSWGWSFETLPCPLWRHYNGVTSYERYVVSFQQSLECIKAIMFRITTTKNIRALIAAFVLANHW